MQKIRKTIKLTAGESFDSYWMLDGWNCVDGVTGPARAGPYVTKSILSCSQAALSYLSLNVER